MECPKCGSEIMGGSTQCWQCGTELTLGNPRKLAPPDYSAFAGIVAEPEYAGFWRRLAAALIDGIILNVVGWIFTTLFHLSALGVALTTNLMGLTTNMAMALIMATSGVWLVVILIQLVLGWFYYAIFECSEYQATPGKMILGIMVTDMDGDRISFGRATGRYFGKAISNLTFSIGYMMAGWTQKKQALHDILADCLVVLK